MGQWEEGMTINVREAGREIHGADNWNMLIDRMQNVVVCRDDRQAGPALVKVCVSVIINWLRTDQF
jgi:hypothetical protein